MSVFIKSQTLGQTPSLTPSGGAERGWLSARAAAGRERPSPAYRARAGILASLAAAGASGGAVRSWTARRAGLGIPQCSLRVQRRLSMSCSTPTGRESKRRKKEEGKHSCPAAEPAPIVDSKEVIEARLSCVVCLDLPEVTLHQRVRTSRPLVRP